jgi:tRNA A37 threonylcarbamoyladenosine synthetase subunit TsaC/SUA5/YrdC
VSYYSLSFGTAVSHQPKPVSIIRVDPGDSTAPRRAVDTLRAGGALVLPTAEGYVVGCVAGEAAVRHLCEITGAAPGDLRYLAATQEQIGRTTLPARVTSDPVPRALSVAADAVLAIAPCGPGLSPAPTAQHAVFILGDRVDLVLDAGAVGRPAAAAVR